MYVAYNYIAPIITPPGRGAKYSDEHVCMSVCSLAFVGVIVESRIVLRRMYMYVSFGIPYVCPMFGLRKCPLALLPCGWSLPLGYISVTHGQTRHNSAHRVVHKLMRCAVQKTRS